jgi:predicted ATPase
LPDIQGGDPGEDADQTGGQLQSNEQPPAREPSTALTAIPILNPTADDLASSAVAAANTGAGHGDHIEL